MDSRALQQRTRQFAIRVIDWLEKLHRSRPAEIITKQLIRCATSVGANYRAACKAKSHADFVAKIGTVEEEADESIYWLELLQELRYGEPSELNALLDEAHQLTAIFTATGRTAKQQR
ncbi:MAG TPA: four helix bundle protein [Elusimicrobiota bacterium]|nr:four helix bundle protein [Elusimicrobiota bacterium]